MPYTALTWVNDAPPPMSAANLNRFTNELKSQASATGIANTLPTWVDGTDPALTLASPWNEIERVTKAVATALGLTYQKLLWFDGWTPARNAAHIQHIEDQLVTNRGVLDSQTGSSIFWGARIDGNAYDVAMAGAAPFDNLPWDTFENATHMNKKVSYLQWGVGAFGNFVAADMNKVRGRGAVPHIETQVKRIGGGTDWTMAEIAAGNADTDINNFANAAAAWGYPFLWRIWWEFNGSWEPNPNADPANYKIAWRRVYNMVKPVAPNCTFLWNPNCWIPGVTSAVDPEPWFPGVQYIDWFGGDGYLRYPPDNFFQTPYDYFQSKDPNIPIYFETGWNKDVTNPVDQLAYHKYWLNMVKTKFPMVKAINLYHRDDVSRNPGLHDTTFNGLRPIISGDNYWSGQSWAGPSGTEVVPP